MVYSHVLLLIVETTLIHKANRKRNPKLKAKNIAEVAARQGLNKK